jgi:hypothetical protein
MITNNGKVKPKVIHIHLEGISEHNGGRIDYTIPPPEGQKGGITTNPEKNIAAQHNCEKDCIGLIGKLDPYCWGETPYPWVTTTPQNRAAQQLQ